MTQTALDLLPMNADGTHNFADGRSKSFMQAVADAMKAAGLGRSSRLNGGEITGYTSDWGSTGFSVSYKIHPLSDQQREFLNSHEAKLVFHVVLSGKDAGLKYREQDNFSDDDDDYDEQLHEPVNPERLNPHIEGVFRKLGLDVVLVKCSGWQTLWDDDVEYNVYTKDA